MKARTKRASKERVWDVSHIWKKGVEGIGQIMQKNIDPVWIGCARHHIYGIMSRRSRPNHAKEHRSGSFSFGAGFKSVHFTGLGVTGSCLSSLKITNRFPRPTKSQLPFANNPPSYEKTTVGMLLQIFNFTTVTTILVVARLNKLIFL